MSQGEAHLYKEASAGEGGHSGPPRPAETTTTLALKDLPADMRGSFSIEWMAQSSQQPARSPGTGSEPTTCGTSPESLPGFYRRPRSEGPPEEGERSTRRTEEFDLSSTQLQHNQSSQGSEVGFSSGTEEETSGYESEGGQSISPSAPTDCTSSSSSSPSSSSCPSSPPAGRRPRTAFTVEQISSMERAFKRNAYLGTQDKAELCKKLNLSDKQVRNWFQNRRMKLKRTVQDALAHACQANVTSQLMHYPELQAYRPGPYPRFPSAGGQEGQSAASYVHPHGLQYGAGLPSVPSLPLDSFYPYSSLPGVMLPAAAAAAASPLMTSYAAYPQYY